MIYLNWIPMNTHTSHRLFEAANRYFPGGVNSPVRAWKSVGGEPIFVAHGSGARLIDADGNEFIDYVGSWGPLILGHAHARVVAAIQDIATKTIYSIQRRCRSRRAADTRIRTGIAVYSSRTSGTSSRNSAGRQCHPPVCRSAAAAQCRRRPAAHGASRRR